MVFIIIGFSQVKARRKEVVELMRFGVLLEGFNKNTNRQKIIHISTISSKSVKKNGQNYDQYGVLLMKAKDV